MKVLRIAAFLSLFAAAFALKPVQAQADLSALDSQLRAKYALTQTTADRVDIVTPGCVLVLNRPSVVMYGINEKFASNNEFRNGLFSQKNGARAIGIILMKPSDEPQSIVERKFVPGEKFWITDIHVQKDAVVLTVYSDPYPHPVYGNLHYYGQLKFPFPDKKTVPPAQVMLDMIDQAISIAALAPSQQQQMAPAPQQAAAPAPVAPLPSLAPPPPPADVPAAQPKTISPGQNRAQVVGILGQPTKDIKLGAKEVLVYPDLKIVLVGGKVTDVQ